MSKPTTTNPALRQIKPAALRKFHVSLAAWYHAQGRHDLPWRHTADAYPIWISEVMLQQTLVATVLTRFYHPFLMKFPTIEALAAAPQEAVLKAWEGLGYYSRARNLHKAAQMLVEEAQRSRRNHAALPDNFDALLALPGIGRNTAQAILAFGYHQPVAIMEANLKRILARIYALETPSDAQLWQAAEDLLNKGAPFDYNQAMMDLGALICLPRAPRCLICPANEICLGKLSPESYPRPVAKKATPIREYLIRVYEDKQGRLHLITRSEKLLGGMWGFPQHDLMKTEALKKAKMLGTVTHVYSHFKLIGHVEHHMGNSLKTLPAAEENWFTREQISELPLSAVDHKILALVEKHHRLKKKPTQT